MNGGLDAQALGGTTGHAFLVVGPEHTAITAGSGDLPVLATPVMIALMEAAACDALAGRLPPAHTSVGIHVDVRHVAASALGARVTASARVVELAGTRITFAVRAEVQSDGESEVIGHGTHVRVAVDRERFLSDL